MREILFRGKTLQQSNWVEGQFAYIAVEGNLYPAIYRTDGKDVYVNRVMSETVGQLTGLQDKNGRKVFEGDILDYSTNYKSYKCVIEWNTEDVGSCGCCWSEFEGVGFVGRVVQHTEYEGSHLASRFNEMEVIGNIWDNPELLAQKSKNTA